MTSVQFAPVKILLTKFDPSKVTPVKLEDVKSFSLRSTHEISSPDKLLSMKDNDQYVRKLYKCATWIQGRFTAQGGHLPEEIPL